MADNPSLDPASGAKTAPAYSLPLLPVTVVGTSSGLTTGSVAVTIASQPNLAITVITPLMALVVRFLNVYLGIIVGLLVTAMAGSTTIAAPDFGHLLLKCATLALSGAAVLSLKDLVTIFGKLEQRFPLASGAI